MGVRAEKKRQQCKFRERKRQEARKTGECSIIPKQFSAHWKVAAEHVKEEEEGNDNHGGREGGREQGAGR